MGDGDAGALYRRLAPAVLGYLRAQRVADPEDVLGEVFLHVARDVHKVKGDDEAVRRWVFAVARHRVIDEARRQRRRPKIGSGPGPEPMTTPDEPFDPALLAALGALTPDQREVVLLRFVADLSLENVARVTHRRISAVKALQHRALANLAGALSPGPSPSTPGGVSPLARLERG